jgi:hypothetical protein
MDVRIIVETTFENGTTKRHRLGRLSRPFRRTQPEGFAILLEDAKTILGQLQNAILRDQIEEISDASRICPDCDGVRAIHDYRSRVLYTLFGRFEVKAPRIRRCACNAKSDVVLGGPLSPLADYFPDRAELGARHYFRDAARILETLLPCAKQVNTSVPNRLGKVDREICDSEQTEPLVPLAAKEAPALKVFLDGAHIRCRPEYQKRHLDVVVGKIEIHDRYRHFGLATGGPVTCQSASPGLEGSRLGSRTNRHGNFGRGTSPAKPGPQCRRWKGPPHPRLLAYLDAYSARRERRKTPAAEQGFPRHSSAVQTSGRNAALVPLVRKSSNGHDQSAMVDGRLRPAGYR